MSKYQIARDLLDDAAAKGESIGWDRGEMMLTVLVTAIEEYTKSAGKKAAVDALNYELSALGGTIDTNYLRSR